MSQDEKTVAALQAIQDRALAGGTTIILPHELSNSVPTPFEGIWSMPLQQERPRTGRERTDKEKLELWEFARRGAPEE